MAKIHAGIFYLNNAGDENKNKKRNHLLQGGNCEKRGVLGDGVWGHNYICIVILNAMKDPYTWTGGILRLLRMTDLFYPKQTGKTTDFIYRYRSSSATASLGMTTKKNLLLGSSFGSNILTFAPLRCSAARLRPGFLRSLTRASRVK